jgi:phosphonopyruvate decarboxylase
MLCCNEIYRQFHECGIGFYSGVPDSLLKDICAHISNEAERHVIAANEGNAIALAAGYYLATGQPGLVYLQNSGMGNAVNPLASLADPQVFGIPMLVLVGWRGQPGTKDEPQHLKQGRIMESLLKALELPYCILPASAPEAGEAIRIAAQTAREQLTPYVILTPEGIFQSCRMKNRPLNPYSMSRECAIGTIIDSLTASDVVISTTGKASRELAEYRQNKGQPQTDLLIVGSMGHASQVALGVALGSPRRKIFCLDGDGAALMHMGGMATIGALRLPNLTHIILNNGAHESVGGQPTAAFSTDLSLVARACGYASSVRVSAAADLGLELQKARESAGPLLIEVCVSLESRPNLGRPHTGPAENKKAFMRFLQE